MDALIFFSCIHGIVKTTLIVHFYDDNEVELEIQVAHEVNKLVFSYFGPDEKHISTQSKQTQGMKRYCTIVFLTKFTQPT